MAEVDPLDDAQRQMIEHQMDLFRQVMAKAFDRIPVTAELDEDAMREVVADLVSEDPEARDLLGRLGVLERFTGPMPPRPGSESG